MTARDLDTALSGMTWTLLEGRFALVGFAGAPTPADLEVLREPPAQLVCEEGETTLLVAERHLAGVLARHPDARAETDLDWVRFEAPMGWEVVGFLARVTTALAAAGVPLGAVCGYSRDHLFLARRHRERALAALGGLFPPG